MKLANLVELAGVHVVRHVTLIAQTDNTFEMEIDIGGNQRIRLEKTRSTEPRRFKSVDGAIAITKKLRVNKLEVILTDYTE